jgi:hypothetical protein
MNGFYLEKEKIIFKLIYLKLVGLEKKFLLKKLFRLEKKSFFHLEWNKNNVIYPILILRKKNMHPASLIL